MATEQQAGKVQGVATFQEPIHAIREGQPVRILLIGDMEGKSPVYFAVDQNGTAKWDSINSFQITDPRALPLSQDQLQRQQDAFQQRRK